MLDDYLIVHKSILPDYYEAVLKTRHLLETGKVSNVSAAVKIAGISRSTYYKYKDWIMEPSSFSSGRKAVLSMLLAHETGILNKVLTDIAGAGASILTITQSLPINNKASVTLSLDIGSTSESPEAMIKKISMRQGVENARIIAIE
ncbi:MAG: ACT domain-containing protein [Sphaerochaetaceae bacterium]|nr:ACT domain-containing protein [Sphaerochaetaceae bacterium]